ncbi:hypothetical protein LY78DRAFT_722861 [Colletotrichum sublineola]|nr:hypothetical protein LY78DRAFT_722861 [Colletotrichum sublineola]
MGLRNGLRLSARRLLRSRGLRNLVLVFAVYTFLDALRVQREVTGAPRHDPKRPRRVERVYIAGMHYNDGALIRDHWAGAVLALVETLGRDNVFTHLEEVEAVPAQGEAREGWITTPRGKREMRRIPFLARLRNLTLKDLWKLGEEGEVFDKVLFLNDVVFTTDDVLALLDTNNGLYAAACSLDFSQPPYYYDTFALRDSAGQGHLMQTWPYFRSRASREAMEAYADAVPVRSCWNGIVAMPAAPFLVSRASGRRRLEFRAVPDSLAEGKHLEASECCLIHADNPLSESLGVFLNPRVRVGYSPAAYEATHPRDSGDSWLSLWRIVVGTWESRVRRLLTSDQVKKWVVRKRVAEWEAEENGRQEKGVHCLINEGQVLVYNGWAHV